MPSRARLQLALDRFQELRTLAKKLAELNGNDAVLRLNELATKLVTAVGSGTNARGQAVVDDAQLNALIKEIDRSLLEFQPKLDELYGSAYRDMGDLVIEKMPGIYEGFGRPAVESIQSARKAFNRSAREYFPKGFSEWADRFQEVGTDLRSGMKRALIRSQLEGWDQRRLAQEFLRTPEFSFSNLPSIGPRGERLFSMGGALDPADALVRRAHLIAETELNAVENRMHLDWTQAAGFDLYYNVNDVPASEVCQKANQAGSMSMNEWKNWKVQVGVKKKRMMGGIPPRHPGCDSDLFAVPMGYDEYADVLASATDAELAFA